MAPKFGTSGLRGLVTELTADCVADYITAFVVACDVGRGVYVGHDLRASSPEIAQMVQDAALAAGVDVYICGPVPTPALALAAMSHGAGAVMITGSHIPTDRNGLKFYTPAGEITKADEAAIVAATGQTVNVTPGVPHAVNDVAAAYQARYADAFAGVLDGRRIGIYAHSAVGRDLMADLIRTLGGDVVELGRSDVFVPVDTEAVDADIRAQLVAWAAEYHCDAIISTDADGDRPLLAGENGRIVVGDVLGQITAAFLGANVVVTPISSNTGVEKSGKFRRVMRTRIGSPFVIADMEAAGGAVVGYEANGGFLLGFDASGPTGAIGQLMTRDALLPILCCLANAGKDGVSESVARQPARFTAADRLQGIESPRSAAFLASLDDASARAAFLSVFAGDEVEHSTIDGLRMVLSNDNVVHLRPSGNAPEFRLYIEAGSPTEAEEMLQVGLDALRGILA